MLEQLAHSYTPAAAPCLLQGRAAARQGCPCCSGRPAELEQDPSATLKQFQLGDAEYAAYCAQHPSSARDMAQAFGANNAERLEVRAPGG